MATIANLVDRYAKHMALTGEAYLKYKNNKGYEEQRDYNNSLYSFPLYTSDAADEENREKLGGH